ncbi:sensor histidine kinase [Actinoplanes sp. NPDC024001]|uniref:sensor histidine kinase n=1 Tax=Actinoplanes sp. NPDC024001 TaxID=3154598 RepID=UPI00340F5562
MPPRRDLVLVAVVLVVDALALLPAPGSPGPAGWLLLIAGAAPLAVRGRFPVAAFAVSGAAAVLYYSSGFPDTPMALGFVIALYTVARDRGRVVTAVAAIALFLAFPAASIADGLRLDEFAGVGAILLAAVAAGEVARTRRERLRLAEERAAEAEAGRAAEGARQAAEERLRIARELHDVLAHQLSLISVQAGAALHRRDADQAFTALTEIRSASKEALREMRGVLGVLRGAEASLARLPELVTQTRSTGLVVELTGEPPALPAAADAAAYRIVQESLTNAMRHAGAGHVHIDVRETGDDVVITIVDDGAGGPAEVSGAGNGLRGMAERAAAVGGRLTAGPGPDGGFRVEARLPRTAPA